MSKIGEKPIILPDEVQVEVKEHSVLVKGKEGEIEIFLSKHLSLERKDNELRIKRAKDEKKQKSLHGLYRSLIANAVSGVQKPWEKRLELIGTGYTVKLQGEDLEFKLGFSHKIMFKKVLGIKFQVEGGSKIVVTGCDKQLVGQVAYKIKNLKKPDVYKGKGILFEGEKLRIKPGKKAKTAEATV